MKNKITLLIVFVLYALAIKAQEDPFVSLEIPAQNMLKFNRFMINPTFSTVRENKSYINVYHRNQWIQYDSAFNTYLLSYSGRVGDKMGLGLSLYHQSFGAISNFGVLANYASGIRLSEKTVLTLGFNLSYYKSGYDQNNAVTTTPDPRLVALEGNSLLGVQPGINLAVGDFDFGIYAENLIDYNLKTGQTITEFSEKTFSGHIQYTKPLTTTGNIMEGGRLMFMARGRTEPENDLNLSGNLLLDLPKLGWFQAGFDDYYGMSAGVGFNLSQRISLGYTFEKGLNTAVKNLGPTHEISFAYSFEPKLTDKMVFLNEDEDNSLANIFEQELEKSSQTAELDILENENIYTHKSDEGKAEKSLKPFNNEEASEKYKSFNKNQRAVLIAKDAEIAQLKQRVNENTDIINELLMMQDSLDQARTTDLERRFAHLMTFIRRGTKDTQVADNNTITNNPPQKESYQPERLAPISINKPIEKHIVKISEITIAKTDDGFNKAEKESLQAMNSDLESLQNKIVENRLIAETLTYKQDSINNAMLVDIEANFNELFKTVTEKEKTSYATNDISTLYMNESEDTVKTTTMVDEKELLIEPTKEVAYANELKKNNIKSSTLNNLEGITSGYYVIANVFSTDLYFDKFMINLNNKQLAPKYFTNPKNHWKYVYLQRFDSWQEAIASYKSNMEGSYIGDMWIMDINVENFNTDNNDKTAPKTEVAILTEHLDNKPTETVSLQTIEDEINKDILTTKKNRERNEEKDKEASESNKLYKKELNKNNIKNGTLYNLKDVQSGYYIIANVFNTDVYFNKFMGKMKNDGMEAQYFVNPRNKLKYVYLKRFETWQDAIKDYKSKLNGTYNDSIWIMKVDNKIEAPILNNLKEEKQKSEKKSSLLEEAPKNDPFYTPNVFNKKPELASKKNLALAEQASEKAYQLALKTNNIKSGTLKNIKGVETGYYMIVNVYGTYIYFEKFFNNLSKKGLNPNYFINEKNNWKYVFLKRFDTWQDAVEAYKSNINNTYSAEKWIMNVKNEDNNIYYPTNKPTQESKPNYIANSDQSKDDNHQKKQYNALKNKSLALLN